MIQREVIYTKKTRIKPTNLYEEARIRLEELRKITDDKENALRKAPPGKIHIVKTQKRIQYYLRKDKSDKSGTYLPKSETGKIKVYLQKSYDEKIFRTITKEIENLEKFLNISSDSVNQIRDIYSICPEQIKSQIDPVDISDEDYRMQWLQIPYEPKNIPDNIPIYLTDKGEHVRSKSELNIANALYKRGVPYKYECPLELRNGMIIHPDFTILDACNRKTVYWEHRGMMDDRDYCKHSVTRIKDYLKNDIFLGDNLIITEETATLPLGTNEINAIIDHFFVKRCL